MRIGIMVILEDGEEAPAVANEVYDMLEKAEVQPFMKVFQNKPRLPRVDDGELHAEQYSVLLYSPAGVM
jgi:hypothetical protein